MAQGNVEAIKLQLAMAFGQGAGVMLASPSALDNLLAEHGWVVDRAARDWDASRWAVIELMRLLGQVSAARAASNNAIEIDWPHVQESLPAVMAVCPCFAAGA
jgi:hypothetical protein